jgi:hypothetical protein
MKIYRIRQACEECGVGVHKMLYMLNTYNVANGDGDRIGVAGKETFYLTEQGIKKCKEFIAAENALYGNRVKASMPDVGAGYDKLMGKKSPSKKNGGK